MNDMNLKRLTLASLILALCASYLGSLSVYAQEADDRFRAGEWDISPFLTYVDKKGDNWGAGAAVTYFPTKNFGIGGSTYWADSGGTLIDNLSCEGYLRLPVTMSLAPYAVASAGYVFETEERSVTLGGGLDLRLGKTLSAFSDIQWRFVEDTKNGVFLRLGVRISF